MLTLAPIAPVARSGLPVKRDQIWQRDHYAEVLGIAQGRIAELGDDWLAILVRYVEERASESSMHAQLDALAHAMAALERVGSAPRPDLAAGRRLLARARAILSAQMIDPRRSRLAELWAEVERHAAQLARRAADTWTAAWHAELANLSAASVQHMISASELALLSGDAASLVSRLLAGELRDLDPDNLATIRVRLLRLGGHPDQATTILDARGADPAFAWERAALRAAATGELTAMANLLRQPDARRPTRQLDFWLWSRAVRSRQWRPQSVKLATLRRHLETIGDRTALECARAIDTLTRPGLKPVTRLHELGKALANATAVDSVERELLIWAAATRCLIQAKQAAFAVVTSARYCALSRLTTAGRSDDVLGVGFHAASDAPTSWHALELGDSERQIPERARDRYVACGQLALELARARLRHRGDTWRAEALAIASDHLSHLKGPIMKLGQMLSNYGLGRGSEEALDGLFDQVPGVPWQRVAPVIEEDLGSIEAWFAELDEVAFAAGSLGQVHRGRLHDGTEVAVKIQYPGAQRAVINDLRVLQTLAPICSPFVPQWDLPSLMNELERALVEETDYLAEAGHQRYFATLFADRDDIVIPRVIDSHTRRRVLVTTLVRGQRFVDHCATAGLAARSRTATRLGRFIVRTGIVDGSGHTDPHPGNFLVDDNTLYVLDFGSAKRWQQSIWRAVLLACMRGDPESLHAAFDRGQMLAGPVDCDTVIATLRRHTMKWTTVGGPTTFASDDVAAEMKAWLLAPAFANLIARPDDLMGFRMYWGAFALIGRLAAPVDLRAVVEQELAR